MPPTARLVGQWLALIGTAASLVLHPPLVPLLLGVLGLLRGEVWGALLMLAGGTALLGGPREPGALVAGGAGVLAFLLAAPLLWWHDRGATAAAALLAVALGAALSSGQHPAPGPLPVASSPLEPLIATDAEPLHGPSRGESLERICAHAISTEVAYRRTTVYDFDDEPLQPLPFGPMIGERPRTTPPRSARELARMLEGRRGVLRDCYRWARTARPGLEARLTIELRCDELGGCDLLSIEPDHPAAVALARCAEEMLGGLELDTPSLRATSARLVLRFAPSGQVPDRVKRPQPPRLVPRHGGELCFRAARRAPDRLAPESPILVIDDFDPDQVKREQQAEYGRKLDVWRRGGWRGPRPAHPLVVSCGCTILRSDGPGQELLRRTLRYNTGRYRACYREVLARRPGLSGRVTLSFVVDRGGNLAARVQSSTAGDRPLEECLRRAIEEVWFAPSSIARTTIVNYPFLLDPTPVPALALPGRARPTELEASAALALALGDGATALRGYSALLRQLPGDPRGCGWRAGAFESLLVIAPWSAEDPRVIEAARSLLRSIAARRDRACLARSLPSLSKLATRPHRDAATGLSAMLMLAEHIYSLLLEELAAFPRETYELRYYHAETLYKLERFAEAAPRYREVALLGGRFARDAAYTQVIALKNVLLPVGWDLLGAACGVEPELARQLTAAIDLYLAQVPDAHEREVLLQHRVRLARCRRN